MPSPLHTPVASVRIALLCLIWLGMGPSVWSQTPPDISCNPNGDWVLITNYDGGELTVVVDQNVPNLRVGICTYEPVNVTFTGPFAGNVTEVLYAGLNSAQNNNNCGFPITTSSFTGIDPAVVDVEVYPPVTVISPPNPDYFNLPNGWNQGIICLFTCDLNTNQGGCNTVDQVVAYFQSQFGGTLRGLDVQYACWTPSAPRTISSITGACCGICPTTSSTSSATVCANELPYVWNGLTFNGSGIQTAVLTNAAGCDSLATFELSVEDEVAAVDVQTACGSFTWVDGITYTASTSSPTLFFPGGSAAGCDSVLTLDLTVHPISSTSSEITACGAFLAPDGTLYTSSTTLTFTESSQLGCDSTVTIDLTIVPEPSISFDLLLPDPASGNSSLGAVPTASGPIATWDWTCTTAGGIFSSTDESPQFNLPDGVYGNAVVQVVATDANGCTATASGTVTLEASSALFVPTSFSPNNDGVNDVFQVEGFGIDPSSFRLEIFNRWGERVFFSLNPDEPWLGNFAGGEYYLPDATYTYLLQIAATERRTGTITLFR